MIRIRGIVKAANKARNSLQVGIGAHEVENFQHFVIESVQAIEQLCAKEHLTPAQLPTLSRKAYYFLKDIDLDNLPVAAGDTAPESAPTLRLKNVLNHQRAIQQLLCEVARSPNPKPGKIREISQNLERTVAAIEQLCIQNQLAPAALTGPSRSAYAWMKFLTDEDNLQLHLGVAHRAFQIAEEIVRQQRQDMGKVIVELTNYGGLYRCRSSHHLTTIQLSEGFIQASDDILTAAITAALLGKSPQITQVLRKFGLSEEYSDVLLALDLMAEVTAETAKGNCYDLDELFEAVNREYFAGQMVKPRLTWNQALTSRKFGHYEQARDRVVISLTLDDNRVPRYVVEFVLYHELLHKHHGSKWVNGKRMSHTPEFRSSEQQFKFYQEAEQWLSQLAAGQVAALTV